MDLYDNVALVGHSNRKVVQAAARQMALLNTNTRYLHDTILRYAERLTAKLPARPMLLHRCSGGLGARSSVCDPRRCTLP